MCGMKLETCEWRVIWLIVGQSVNLLCTCWTEWSWHWLIPVERFSRHSFSLVWMDSADITWRLRGLSLYSTCTSPDEVSPLALSNWTGPIHFKFWMPESRSLFPFFTQSWYKMTLWPWPIVEVEEELNELGLRLGLLPGSGSDVQT